MRYKFIFFILLSTFSFHCVQQACAETYSIKGDCNGTASNDSLEAVRKNDELKKSIRLLEDSLKHLNDSYKDLSKQKEFNKKEVVKKRQTLRNEISKNKQQYESLINKNSNLRTSIADKKREYDRKSSILDSLKSIYDILNSKKSKLTEVKDEVSTQLIGMHAGYVESPFSQISIEQLIHIKSECRPYTIDKSINAFVAKVDNTINNKNIYDEVSMTLSSPFKKTEVTNAVQKLSMVSGCSEAQQAEFNLQKEQLLCFEDGLTAFKEFIKNLNACKNGLEEYSLEYYEADKGSILPAELQNRINNKLLKVPYLKSKFEEYMKEFESAPSKTPSIETEILGQ